MGSWNLNITYAKRPLLRMSISSIMLCTGSLIRKQIKKFSPV